MSPLPWRVEQQGGEILLVDRDGLPICHYFRDLDDAWAIYAWAEQHDESND
jgi:hypothetical protein